MKSKYSEGPFVLNSREPLKRVYREVVCDVCSVVSLPALDRICSLLIKYHKVTGALDEFGFKSEKKSSYLPVLFLTRILKD